jgi:Zn-finger nucleic acid-binding protein
MPHRRDSGTHWDTAELRREREYGWFRQHEAELIEQARRRRAEAEALRKASEEQQIREAHRSRCPKCGAAMSTNRIEEIEVDKCPSCEGIFFDRGELETLLLRHDAHRRGFFRKLLGFHPEPEAESR